ncbi:EamA family transporter [Baaleninema simplex]|uniref:EamA family transporter n=1 Tax=Baaleninema simplex TaxID=2862350 RepID=UPI00034DCBE1|nr:EamA family transporter [Baaleninema simplex]
MLWLILTLVTAFSESLRDVSNKKSLQASDAYVVAWSLNATTAVFLLPGLVWVGIPELGEGFVRALIAGSLLNAIAYLLFVKAIQLSDLSKVAPLTTLTPLFLLGTSPLLVGEFPHPLGIVGILCIVVGAYLLNFSVRHRGYFAPLWALWEDTGAKLMLTVAFLWSLTSNIDKIGLQNSSPLFWVTAIYAINAVVLFPLVLVKSKRVILQLQGNGVPLLAIGFFNAIALTCQMTALSLTLVAYVISVKRTSAVFSVLWGKLLFREVGLKERLSGAVVMVVGVAFIALSEKL